MLAVLHLAFRQQLHVFLRTFKFPDTTNGTTIYAYIDPPYTRTDRQSYGSPMCRLWDLHAGSVIGDRSDPTSVFTINSYPCILEQHPAALSILTGSIRLLLAVS